MRRYRALDADDTEWLAEFVEQERPGWSNARHLRRELRDDSYLWLGSFSSSDVPMGVHRALRLGEYFVLKGLFVSPSARGSGVGLQLALEMRARGRAASLTVAAWVDTGAPERHLARVLGLVPSGPPMFRYRFVYMEGIDGDLVRELGNEPKSGEANSVSPYTLDRDVVIFAEFPGLATLFELGRVRAMSTALSSAIVFPCDASDILMSLHLRRMGCVRVSTHVEYFAVDVPKAVP
jgi:GNAT superfamily N-acetyltransferase